MISLESKKTIDLVEEMVKGLLRGGVYPDELLIGIHNAMVHGEILKEVGFTDFGKGDRQLSNMFNGFETSIKAARKIVDKN